MSSKNDSTPKTRALADVATNRDTLFYDGYVKGIAEFIKDCATPMTIAIQGDWGSGKTSLINLLDAELRAEAPDSGTPQYCEDIITVANVDAWQQSVANPHASLLENLLVEMLLKISGVNRDVLENFAGLMSAVSQIVGANYDSGKKPEEDSLLGSLFDAMFGSESNSKRESKDEFISSKDIKNFQKEFSETLLKAAQDNGKSEDSRFVIFIDGLDHADPEAAIVLMEQIKTYLDCPRCIFVYAIDERTVYDGVRKKLGDKVDEGRKKMFFEKLVQVPLRIPASVCNLEKYIGGLLKDDEELAGEFARVINTLVKNPTPLSIKRFINTMYLYRNAFNGVDGTDGESLAMLLAAVILEIEDAQGFNAVANCAQGGEAHFEEKLEEAQGSLDQKSQVLWGNLSDLWHDESAAGTNLNVAMRGAFISWLQKLS